MAPNYRVTHIVLNMLLEKFLSVDLTYLSIVNITILYDMQVLHPHASVHEVLSNLPLSFVWLAKNYLVLKTQLRKQLVFGKKKKKTTLESEANLSTFL